MTQALEVTDLTVSLGGAAVLRGLTFSVARGTSLAIIGPNGAGKTVLLKTLIGALPYTGTISWAPQTVLGYVPQKLDIERDLPLNGRDFLRAKAALVGAGDREIEGALHSVGMDEKAFRGPIGAMSGGEFQRLLIAFALLGRPNVLLLDEPAAGVDAPGHAKLNEVIESLGTGGMTVLLVSHDLSVVYRYAGSVLCLGRHGACMGPPRTLLTQETLTEVYGAPIGFHVHDHD